jgi:hypothetical protein
LTICTVYYIVLHLHTSYAVFKLDGSGFFAAPYNKLI